MSSSGWEILDVCGIENCRTKKYKRDTDGYLYCKNGHRYEVSLRENSLITIIVLTCGRPHWLGAKMKANMQDQGRK